MTRRPTLTVRWEAASQLLASALAHGYIPDTRAARSAKQRVAHLRSIADERVPRLAVELVVRCPDGYPAGGEGSGSGTSSVEAALEARRRVTEDHAVAVELVGRCAAHAHTGATGHLWQPQTVVGYLDDLLGLCDRYSAPEPGTAERLRCTGGTSEPGGLEWGHPECDNIASRRGLCNACRMRQSRWERRAG